MKKYDTLVYILRAQPLHNAHVETIRRATYLARQVIIIVGSAKQPRTYKNPFTSHERELMIKSALETVGDKTCSIRVEHNIDTIYNDPAWAIRVQAIVAKHTLGLTKIGIIGHKKADTEAYLSMFPQWQSEEIPELEPLNATKIRDLYFRDDVNMNFIKHVVPTNTFEFLMNFKNTRDYRDVVAEREFIENYKKQYASYPYPPTFVTVDSIVLCSGNVLLVERRGFPGKGLLALPGGFLAQDELIIDGAIRELREETRIKVPAAVLKGSVKSAKVFDHPNRSQRGRTITHCFLIELSDRELPKVKGSDDAAFAKWYPLGEVDSEKMFEDHYQIIKDMVGF